MTLGSEQTKRIPYPSDLFDLEWELIKLYFHNSRTNKGRKRFHPYREVLNAVFYLLRLVVPGECYPTNFHRGKLCTTISVFSDLLDFRNV